MSFSVIISFKTNPNSMTNVVFFSVISPTISAQCVRYTGFVSSLSSMASSAAGAMGPQSNGVLDPSKRPRPQCCPMCPSLDHMVHGSMEPMVKKMILLPARIKIQ